MKQNFLNKQKKKGAKNSKTLTERFNSITQIGFDVKHGR